MICPEVPRSEDHGDACVGRGIDDSTELSAKPEIVVRNAMRSWGE